MMGSNCESYLSMCNTLKDFFCGLSEAVSFGTAYQIQTSGVHGESEIAVPFDLSSFIISLSNMMIGYREMNNSFQSMGNSLYTSKSSFNNGYGSPWPEVDHMISASDTVLSYMNSFPTIDFVGMKSGLIGVCNTAISRCVDAKWALTYYHDYIQRGFDHIQNGDNPSIKFKQGLTTTGVGNVDQSYSENVNVARSSLDPF